MRMLSVNHEGAPMCYSAGLNLPSVERVERAAAAPVLSERSSTLQQPIVPTGAICARGFQSGALPTHVESAAERVPERTSRYHDGATETVGQFARRLAKVARRSSRRQARR